MGSLVSAGLGLAGSLLGGRSAQRAAQTSANAQLEAARIAAEEARFRPVGITTRFGQSAFQTSPEGRVTGAGYELSPELRAYQDRLMGLTGMGLAQAEAAPGMYQPLMAAAPGLFGLAQGYLAETPQQAAQQYMARQQELLAPSRERQLSQLQNRLFQTGREGLAIGATGARPSGAAGLGAASPEMEAYYNALAQQDAELATRAQQAGMEQTRFGAGLFGTGADLLGKGYAGQVAALSPYEAYLGQAQTLEGLGQQPLNLGINIGAKGQSPASADALLRGGMGAATSMQRANAYNPFAEFLLQSSQTPGFSEGLVNLFSNKPSINALDTSAYGFGLPGFEAAQADIYGR